MGLIFINQNSEYYKKAVDLRIALFFNNMDNAEKHINDIYENRSTHLVYINEKEVVGTGRLTIEKKYGIISQMAISSGFQNKGIGSKILLKLLEECSNLKLDRVELNARKTAIDFYKKFGFQEYGDYFKSEKTGIIHKKMIK